MENPYRQFQEDLEQEVVVTGHVTTTRLNNTLLDDDDGNRNGNGNGKLVRLRAVETEREFFLKTMNVTTLRWLAWTEAGAAVVVFISQIALYGAVSGSFGRYNYFKPVDYSGMGIWAPLVFFLVAAGLTWMATKYPSGCNIGTAMGFQIASIIFASILIFLAVISLMMHGRYNYSEDTYDPEVLGRVFCSFMVLATGLVIVSALFASIHFCRCICCGRQRIMESVMFDVITDK